MPLDPEKTAALAPPADLDDDQPRRLGRLAARDPQRRPAAGDDRLAPLGRPAHRRRRRGPVARAVAGQLPGPYLPATPVGQERLLTGAGPGGALATRTRRRLPAGQGARRWTAIRITRRAVAAALQGRADHVPPGKPVFLAGLKPKAGDATIPLGDRRRSPARRRVAGRPGPGPDAGVQPERPGARAWAGAGHVRSRGSSCGARGAGSRRIPPPTDLRHASAAPTLTWVRAPRPRPGAPAGPGAGTSEPRPTSNGPEFTASVPVAAWLRHGSELAGQGARRAGGGLGDHDPGLDVRPQGDPRLHRRPRAAELAGLPVRASPPGVGLGRRAGPRPGVRRRRRAGGGLRHGLRLGLRRDRPARDPGRLPPGPPEPVRRALLDRPRPVRRSPIPTTRPPWRCR